MATMQVTVTREVLCQDIFLVEYESSGDTDEDAKEAERRVSEAIDNQQDDVHWDLPKGITVTRNGPTVTDTYDIEDVRRVG